MTFVGVRVVAVRITSAQVTRAAMFRTVLFAMVLRVPVATVSRQTARMSSLVSSTLSYMYEHSVCITIYTVDTTTIASSRY